MTKQIGEARDTNVRWNSSLLYRSTFAKMFSWERVAQQDAIQSGSGRCEESWRRKSQMRGACQGRSQENESNDSLLADLWQQWLREKLTCGNEQFLQQ